MKAAAAILLMALGLQTPETFEVASLKPSRPGTRFRSSLDATQCNFTAHSLTILIMSAYADIEVQPWKLAGGPVWADTDRWDLAAKLPPNMPTDQEHLYRRTEAMLRNFLADEFKLKTHPEMRDFPVYALVVAKNGAKLKPSETGEFDGFFDFTLEWTPDTTDSASDGPSLFTALEQQLGLRLQPEKAPIEFLLIHHAEKSAGN